MICGREPLGGGGCELSRGHDGKHKKTAYHYKYPDPTPVASYEFEWDDASQAELAKKYCSGWD